jgi:tyrosyl-tRNA synthetase
MLIFNLVEQTRYDQSSKSILAAMLKLSQIKIFKFAQKFLPQLGYKDRGRIMIPMLPNLFGEKMSSSDPPHTKIMFLDSAESVKEKIILAFHSAKHQVDNSVLAILRDILFPLNQLRMEGVLEESPRMVAAGAENTVFTVKSDGTEKHYRSYNEVEQDLVNGMLSQECLAEEIGNSVNNLLLSIREAYNQDVEWQDADRLGYPE